MAMDIIQRPVGVHQGAACGRLTVNITIVVVEPLLVLRDLDLRRLAAGFSWYASTGSKA